MATLSYADLKKRNNMHKFIDKTFGRKGNDGGDNENNWMDKQNGLFMSESIEIGGELYKKYDPILPDRLISAKNANAAGIFLHGKYSSGKKGKVKLTQLEKSSEFGGQGSQGNKGHQFEALLDARLNECTASRCCKGPFADEAKHLIELVSKQLKSNVKGVELMGGKNQPRPIKIQGGKPYIEPMQPIKHGEKLTDITMYMSGNNDAYLSLKAGNTLTFINAGVAKDMFVQSEMEKGAVKKSAGVALLDVFGLDNSKFCQVFNNYGSGEQIDNHIVDVTKDVNKSNLNNFMQTAIGANYFMIHELNGKIYYWWVGEKENKNYANISGSKVIAYYGGKNGKGKRIDVEFSNNYYDFKMNIRNKQSGQYPSHIMLDYTSKPAIGKTIL